MSAMLEFDTGPLNWVRGDIEAALKSAANRIQAYQTDSALENALRLARDETHQATGALRMVGLEGAAVVATALEEALSALDAGSVPSADVLPAVLEGLEALLKWVSRMAEGRGQGELALFPAYRKLRELNGAEQVFEGELFFPNLQVRATHDNSVQASTTDIASIAKVARAGFQRGLLAFLRGTQAEAGLAAMRKSLSQIEAAVSSQAARTFWWACVGFIDALQNKGVEPDFHVKQLLARVDLQMRRLIDGSPQVAERLMRDALFFIAKSKSVGNEAQAVRSAFALEKYLPRQTALNADQISKARPHLEAIKGTLADARRHWSAVAEGHVAAVNDFASVLSALASQASTFPVGSLPPLVMALQQAASECERPDNAVREAASLEIATTLLFLQNATLNEDIFEHDFSARADSQIRRLRAALSGQAEANAQDLLDTNSRKAAEHALMVQLGREIGSSLHQLEESLDAFFRDADERKSLLGVDALVAQIHGALGMMEQDDASQLLERAIAMIKPYTAEGTPNDAEKTLVADALSSLGLFVDAHCAGRQDAARILLPVRAALGLAEPELNEAYSIATVEEGLEARKAAVAASYLDWQNKGGADTQKKFFAALTELGHDADLIADKKLKSAVEHALSMAGVVEPGESLAAAISQLTGHDIHFPDATVAEESDEVRSETGAVAAGMADFTETQTDTTQAGRLPRDVAPTEIAANEPAIAEPAAIASDCIEAREPAPELDRELLEIFLEEASEVLQTMDTAAEQCRRQQNSREDLTTIRRAFHTLKGSGRMVGLEAFGEVAWGLEQLMNTWLAEDRPANEALLDTVIDAHDLFDAWVSRLNGDSRAVIDATTLLARAAALAHGEARVKESTTPQTEATFDTGATQDTPNTPDIAIQATSDTTTNNTPETTTPTETAEQEDILIAGIRLSPGLYAIFRDESVQWSRIMRDEADSLSSGATQSVSDIARRGVHTLAGIAGTTGFFALAELAHAVETYLKALGDKELPYPAQATVRDALSRIAGMIDNIHANASPLPAESLIRELAILQLEQSLPDSDATQLTEFEKAPFTNSEQDLQEIPSGEATDFPAEALSTHESDAATEPPIEAPISAHADNPIAATQGSVDEPPAEEARLEDLVAQARRQAMPVFEQRQVNDEIDAELLPIFLEEASDLIPQAAENLRQWKANPDHTDAPSALRRVLHTIKGSARMAGAMRLGELTHLMESRVIAVLENGLIADSSVFDTLENQFDRMANDVDRLHQGRLAPEATVDAAAETTHSETATGETGVLLPAESGANISPVQSRPQHTAQAEGMMLRVRSDWVDRLVNEAGETAIARSRIENEMFAVKRQVTELSEALRRLKNHLREVEIQAEAQMQATFHSQGGNSDFDPLEFDRFTRFQEVTRFLAESVHDISTVHQNLAVQLDAADAALVQQARMNRELQQNLLRIRMVPLQSVSERLHRIVRQTARTLGKRAQLEIRNGELELDRGVLEKIVAPLEHLLRNAVAHGLELPVTRTAAGKPEFGEIRIEARQEGNEMLLTLSDDGVGLDLDRIHKKAIAQNLLSVGVEPSANQLAHMIFVPGFSTADEVTEVAGRGVGMDVVKSEISALGGRIEIATEHGKGVRFDIFLPLTLAVTQAVIVQAGKQEYALPATMVEQVQELKPAHLEAALSAGAIEWRGNRYPLFYLPRLLGQTEIMHEVQRFNTVVLMKSGGSHAALLVDAVEGAREIVVKNIGPQVARLSGIAGATVRGDGRIMLILNPVPLAMRALAQSANMPVSTPAPVIAASTQDTVQAPLVMVVDDSLTVRKITSRLMSREGYRVDTAKDGVDALEKMQDLTPDIVLLDVEMPRMDGFELARVMRNDHKLKQVPIIMITSRTADKHRKHALDIGVDVYLGKPFQETVLLGHIGELLGEHALAGC